MRAVHVSVSDLAGFRRAHRRRRQAGAQVCSRNVLMRAVHVSVSASVSVSDLAGFRRPHRRRRLAGAQVCPVLRV